MLENLQDAHKRATAKKQEDQEVMNKQHEVFRHAEEAWKLYGQIKKMLDVSVFVHPGKPARLRWDYEDVYITSLNEAVLYAKWTPHELENKRIETDNFVRFDFKTLAEFAQAMEKNLAIYEHHSLALLARETTIYLLHKEDAWILPATKPQGN